MKKLLENRKGTAEVIGTIMFVMILMFFFTNVYLWHDAATKKMDDMYVQKINTPLTVSLMNGNTQLNVTDKGGEDIKLTMLWVDCGTGPDQTYSNFTVTNVVPAGSSIALALPSPYDPPSQETVFTVITTLGNSASCPYPS